LQLMLPRIGPAPASEASDQIKLTWEQRDPGGNPEARKNFEAIVGLVTTLFCAV